MLLPNAPINRALLFFFTRQPPKSPLFPYTTLFRSSACAWKSVCESRSASECWWARSEEHTSELQLPYDLVCRLLLEKKKEDRAEGVDPEAQGLHESQGDRRWA